MLSKDTDQHIYDFYIISIAHALRYLNDQKLEDYNITHRQAKLLGILYRNIKTKQENSNKKLQEMMNLKGPSITSLLNGLEKNGFIIRHPKHEDHRFIEYALTPQSIALIEDMNIVFTKTENRLLQSMSEEEKQIFLQLLRKAHQNLSAENTNINK